MPRRLRPAPSRLGEHGFRTASTCAAPATPRRLLPAERASHDHGFRTPRGHADAAVHPPHHYFSPPAPSARASCLVTHEFGRHAGVPMRRSEPLPIPAASSIPSHSHLIANAFQMVRGRADAAVQATVHRRRSFRTDSHLVTITSGQRAAVPMRQFELSPVSPQAPLGLAPHPRGHPATCGRPDTAVRVAVSPRPIFHTAIAAHPRGNEAAPGRVECGSAATACLNQPRQVNSQLVRA